jgi:hypothetical protein
MVLPPNRLGAIRGPNGATLDDVVARLDATNNALEVLTMELQGAGGNLSLIRQRLDTLVSTGSAPASWPGLPAYLHAVVGTTGQASELQANILTLLGLDAGSGALLAQVLTGSPTSPGTGVLFELLTAVNAVRGGGALGLADMADILAALGAITHPPNGSNLKDLLRSMDANLLELRDCACEGGGGGNNFIAVPPAENCAGEPANWQECELLPLFSNEDAEVFAVRWPENVQNAGGDDWRTYNIAQAGDRRIIGLRDPSEYVAFESVPLCIAYSFDPATSPLYNYGLTSVIPYTNLLPYNFYVSFNPAPPPQSGAIQISVTARSGGDNLRGGAAMNVAFQLGSGPGVGKVWASGRLTIPG